MKILEQIFKDSVWDENRLLLFGQLMVVTNELGFYSLYDGSYTGICTKDENVLLQDLLIYLEITEHSKLSILTETLKKR